MSQRQPLFIEEVLRVVLEYIPATSLREKRTTLEHVPPLDTEASRTLARTARVCRALSGPALDVLWRDLYDIEHLLRLFSAFQVKSGKPGQQYLCINGDISDQEWARFVTYAKRVQRFEYSRRTFEVAVFERLSQLCKGNPLLPSLRELRWQLKLPYLPPAILLFIAPGLRLLALHGHRRGLSVVYPFDRTAESRRYELPITMIRKLADTALGLEVLSFPQLSSDSEFWEALRRLPKLNTVRCLGELFGQDLPTVCPSLHALAAMPSLRSLEVFSHYGGDNGQVPFGSLACESLEILKLRTSSFLNQSTPFFLALSLPRLHSLSLVSFVYLPMLQLNMQTIASRFAASLREVHLALKIGDPVTRGILFAPLLPLLQLPKLTAVSLRVSTGPGAFGLRAEQAVTDNDIFSIASAWPRLRDLSIIVFNFELSGCTLPTLGCLQSFADFCPDLRSLALPITPITLIGHAADLVSPALHAHPLEKLSLQLLRFNDSRSRFVAAPGELEAMARTVSQLFPSLNLAMCLSPLWGERGRGPNSTDPTPWDSVVEAIASLQGCGRREVSILVHRALDARDLFVNGDGLGADEDCVISSLFA